MGQFWTPITPVSGSFLHADQQKAKAVWLYRAFFDGGNWRLLSSKAKAVYPVVLAFSVFYLDLYWELKGTDEESLD